MARCKARTRDRASGIRRVALAWVWLLSALLAGCSSTPSPPLSDWEHTPHAQEEDCGHQDRCVTLVCAEELCGLYFCEQAGVLLARGGGTIAPPAAPGPGPRRYWGSAQKLPGGGEPIFIIRWHNAPQPEHRPPRLPSGPEWERHHLFPQAPEFAKWFARSPRRINVHDFTMVIPRSTHQRVHNGERGGPWNADWREFTRKHPEATQQEVWQHLGELIKKYDLLGPIVPYHYLR